MTYSVGGLIQAADYNTFAGAATNSVTAIGSVYGQTNNTPNVAALGTVTATQWANLVNKITSYGNHTNTTLTSRTAPVTGNTISILANVQTDLNNVYSNRYNAVSQGTQYTGWTGTNSKTTATSGATWSITFTNTVTFANTTAATNFFNAGGTIKVQTSKTSTGNVGDPPWNDLAGTLMGAMFISAGNATVASQTIAGTSYTGTTKVGGTGTPTILLTGTGWTNLVAAAAPTAVYKQFSATAPYTADFIQHSIAKDATGTALIITTLWSASDGDAITGGTSPTGATPGTAPCTIVTYFPPETTNLTDTWGTPTVVASVA